MAPFQKSGFTQARQGLFSAQEIEGLMRVEFERAQRHGHPLVAMVITVDRLGALADLYGNESREEILRAVEQSLRDSTRESDLITLLQDDRLIALFPHAEPQVAPVVAKKLLTSVRAMRFDRDGRTVRATISIGISHNRHKDAISFETLVGVAEEGLRVADAAGGDRFIETELYQLYERQRRGREISPAPAIPDVDSARAGPAGSSGASKAALLLGETLLELFTARGVSVGADGKLDHEALMRMLIALQDERVHSGSGAQELAEVRRQNELLERRIAKLIQELGLTADELRRVAELKSVDAGVASIYKTVQGLKGAEANAERKREMMKEIFQANVALKKTLKPDSPSA
jgi:diguanylate cyclase (GGDEF)-like protein